jgi:hypothetical protein
MTAQSSLEKSLSIAFTMARQQLYTIQAITDSQARVICTAALKRDIQDLIVMIDMFTIEYECLKFHKPTQYIDARVTNLLSKHMLRPVEARLILEDENSQNIESVPDGKLVNMLKLRQEAEELLKIASSQVDYP